MRKPRILMSAIALALGAGTAFIVGASPALASSLPKTQTEMGGWDHGWRTRPSAVYLGGGASFSSPSVRHLHWVYYTNKSGYARGQTWLDLSVPSAGGKPGWVSDKFYVYDPVTHRGPGRNFAKARDVCTYRGKTYTATFYILGNGDWAERY
jgi:hypothetical protein